MFDALFGKKGAEGFWEWFGKHEAEIRNVQTGQEPIIAKTGKALQRANKGLVWECGKAPDGVMEFTISADGIRDHFPAVCEFVAKAPKLPGWRFNAFRQRAGEGIEIEMNGRRLSPDSVFFQNEPAGNKVDLQIFVDGLNRQNEEAIAHVCFILLDATIGEEDVVERVRALDFRSLAESPGNLKPLRELPQVIDALK